jgi:hypothetical protein
VRLLQFAIAFVLATAGFADTLTLKSGRVINGTYLGGTARQVRMEVGDQIQSFDTVEVSRIEFGTPARAAASTDFATRPAEAPAPAPPPPPPPPVQRRTENVFRPEDTPAPAPAQRAAIDLPAGTDIVIRMIDGVDSEVARVGQTFAASIDEPVTVNGETMIPRGADVTVKLVDAKDSGKLTGKAELTLDLVSVKINGRMVDLNTQTVSRESASRGNRTAKVAGGTAALGAIIGAIAGGGKGAAIGAAAGAGAGAGAEIITKGQQVKIPSETRLTFVLDTPVRI